MAATYTTPAKATQLLPQHHRIVNLPLRQQAIWYQRNITHATVTLHWWKNQRPNLSNGEQRSFNRIRARELRFHVRLYRNATRNLAVTESKIRQQSVRQYLSDCIIGIIKLESSRSGALNPFATNPNSGAYGIPQALPGSKMARFGSDWRSNKITQLKWMWWYVKERYGGDCAALNYRIANGYY